MNLLIIGTVGAAVLAIELPGSESSKEPRALWSRRSFVKAGVCGVIRFRNSNFTEELMAAQQTLLGRESTEPTKLSIREAGDLVRRKVLSPVELTRACLRRIERLNPALNAVITVTAEQVT